MDDYTLMTTESMALVLNDDGCCVRHPSIKLKEYDENGDVFLKEACPECQSEFQQTQDALLQKRKELDTQLNKLGDDSPHDERHADFVKQVVPAEEQQLSTTIERTDSDRPIIPMPPPAMKELTLEGLAGHMLHIQQMQDILMFQKDKEVSDLKKKVEQQQVELTDKQVEIALLQERMAQQKNDMERELKLIKRAVAMDRERRMQTSSPTHKDIHINELHVHKIPTEEVEQAAAVSAQQYMEKMGTGEPTKAEARESPPIVVDKARSRSSSHTSDDTPDTSNVGGGGGGAGVMAAAAVGVTAAAITSSSKETPPPSPKKYNEPPPARVTNRYESKGEVPAVLGPSAETTGVKSAPPVEVKKREQDIWEQDIQFVPTKEEEKEMAKEKEPDIQFVPDETPLPPGKLKIPPDEEEEDSLDDNFEKKPQGVAKLPEDMFEEDDEVESEKEDSFDAGFLPTDHVGTAPAVTRKHTPASYKKPGPLTTPKILPSDNPTERRGEPMHASLNSLEPPGSLQFQTASDKIPTVREFSGSRGGNGPVKELEINSNLPPVVPLEEQVTIGTLEDFPPSNQFIKPRAMPSDEGTVGQNTIGPTVASSTVGEDRQLVKNKLLLDPYGDKGIYSGVVLMSTGLPHGNGKMVYEDDGRTYDGDWRHGRWHGWGNATFSNGDAFEGYYKYDQRHGHGKYSWRDGRIYEGEFKEDKRHGKGHFIWPDGADYVGDFADGQRDGRGRYIFSDGGRYVGAWANGRYEGYGECQWHDGRNYKGYWKAGMAHGEGTETYPDGRVRHSGQWIKDEPVRDKSTKK